MQKVNKSRLLGRSRSGIPCPTKSPHNTLRITGAPQSEIEILSLIYTQTIPSREKKKKGYTEVMDHGQSPNLASAGTSTPCTQPLLRPASDTVWASKVKIRSLDGYGCLFYSQSSWVTAL